MAESRAQGCRTASEESMDDFFMDLCTFNVASELQAPAVREKENISVYWRALRVLLLNECDGWGWCGVDLTECVCVCVVSTETHSSAQRGASEAALPRRSGARRRRVLREERLPHPQRAARSGRREAGQQSGQPLQRGPAMSPPPLLHHPLSSLPPSPALPLPLPMITSR